jgi:hypothetical protein
MVGRKGQGAIEYLLILAAVLIVVAGAVYYVTRTGGFPAMSMSAYLSGDNVMLKVDSGKIKAGDWAYRGITSAGQLKVNWTTGTDDLEPGAIVNLVELAGKLSAGDIVQIKHIPSGHVYSDLPVA